jgi:hypothetical protein
VCRLTFYLTHGKAEVIRNGAFVKGAIHFSQEPDQPSLWQDRGGGVSDVVEIRVA